MEVEGGAKDGGGVGFTGSKDDTGKLKSEGEGAERGEEMSEMSFLDIGAGVLDVGCSERGSTPSLTASSDLPVCEGSKGAMGTGIVGRTGSGRFCGGSVLCRRRGVSEGIRTDVKRTFWTSVMKSSTRSSFVLESCRWRCFVLEEHKINQINKKAIHTGLDLGHTVL